MALHPEVDSAIDEVVNEFIVSDANDTPVEINLDNLDVGSGVKNRIRNEFEHIKKIIMYFYHYLHSLLSLVIYRCVCTPLITRPVSCTCFIFCGITVVSSTK